MGTVRHTSLTTATAIQRGFTLVEAMVVVALIAILASLAGPSFLDSFSRYRVEAARESLSASINLARSEAIRRGQSVVIRRRTGCGIVLENNRDWSCGWQMFADIDGNTFLSGAEVILQQVDVPTNTRVRKGNVVNPGFISINRFGQITQAGQRFEFFAAGQAVTDGQLLCFTTGTRVRTVKNAAVCPP